MGKHDAYAWVDADAPELAENELLGWGPYIREVVTAGLTWAQDGRRTGRA